MEKHVVVVLILCVLVLPACTGPGEEKAVQIDLDEEKGAALAESFILDSSTYRFDGFDLNQTRAEAVGNTLSLTYEFKSQHAGYGDRSAKVVADVVTPHSAKVFIENGKVVQATLDGNWDMLRDEFIGTPPESSCKDACGDGVCQETACQAVGCPCPETAASCPQDCKNKETDYTYCSYDLDCACGGRIGSSECFYGNKKYVDAKKQCPDYCSGIGGEYEIKCVANQCIQVRPEKCLGEGEGIGHAISPEGLEEVAKQKDVLCCEGLTKVSDSIRPDSAGKCEQVIGYAGSVCTYCGDGVCGKGENACNCPLDCANGSKNDPLRAAAEEYIKKTAKYRDLEGVNLTETDYRRESGTREYIRYNYSSGLNKTAGRVESVEVKLTFENGKVIGISTSEIKILGPVKDFCGFSTNASCAKDADCIAGGCNHEVCQSRNEEPVNTSCGYRGCYSAGDYGMECQCWSNHCRWFK